MPEFIIAYHGGKEPESPEEGAKHMERWKAWLGNLGDAVVNPGTPLKDVKTVTADGMTDATGDDRLTGFTVVNAEGIDGALAMAKDCPFLDMGTLTVAEMIKMG